MDKDKLSDVGDEELPLVRARRSHYHQKGGMQHRLRAFSLSHYLTDTSGHHHHYNRLGGGGGADHLPLSMQKLNHKHVGAYILALQVITASLATCAVSIAMPYLLPLQGVAALRNLVFSAITGIVLLFKPLLTQTDGAVLQTVPPLRHIFKSLRNAVAFVLLALVVESLMDSSCVLHEHGIGVLRHSAMVIAFCFVFAASWWRAFWPQSESDVASTVALAFLVVLVCLPQTQDFTGNPLAKQLDFASGGVRVCRVLLFSVAYTGTCLASTPVNVFFVDPLVLSVRALSATCWILVSPPPLLGLVVPFCFWLCLRRINNDSAVEYDGTESHHETDDTPHIVEGLVYAPHPADDIKELDVGPSYTVPPAPPPSATGGCAGGGGGGSGLSEDRKRYLLSKLGAH